MINLIAGILVAVITAHLTVRLALKRFYSEKWWERRSAAYEAIIVALHHVRNHADTNLAFSIRGKDLPPEGDVELTQKLQVAMAELRKHKDIGSFVISKDALRVLNELFSELEASTNTVIWQEHLGLKLAALDKHLPEMCRIAHKDLALK